MISMVFPYIVTTKKVYASAEVLWQILTDTAQWVHWGPSIRKVECSERNIRQGSKGRVQTTLGFWLSFEVTEYMHEQYWAWRVSGIPATGHRIEPLSDKMCRLTFEVPVFAVPYVGICAIAVKRISCIAENKGLVENEK
jgi:hypothetical protein